MTAHRRVEVSAVLLTPLIVGYACWRLWLLMAGPATWWTLGLAALAGYIGADFMSGTVHWLADRFGTPETPVVGPNFIKPFREHHKDPEDITRHDFFETNGNSSVVSMPLLLATALLVPTVPGALLNVFILGSGLSLVLGVLATNQFHKWAHMETPPSYVKRLQRWGLILERQHHLVHHQAPFATYYCITTGWLNPLLQRLRIFETLESLSRRFLGAHPGESDQVYLNSKT